ncbi:cupin domain-containing protein [Roseomonas populi]|uniref:Cupin domain-containing protein n=1 Tax=Roseomonas populi TaxID=3121582 RepID=A0ABT1X3L2_9PROT|nr:cupin domain-containing protein [Roseomonas pecuniae]MCR0981978.1 cupin domain-containing protein [Roseomonas pecuniae]
MVPHGNLHEGLAADPAQEVEETLLSRPGLRIGRIVSAGQASPPGFWYDQAEDEFVLLVAGEAVLDIEGESTSRRLRPGDWVHLPARRRHRVAWTQAEPPTLWFVIHHAP